MTPDDLHAMEARLEVWTNAPMRIPEQLAAYAGEVFHNQPLLIAALRAAWAETAGLRAIAERARDRGCTDPEYGGCMGEPCLGCAAKKVLATIPPRPVGGPEVVGLDREALAALAHEQWSGWMRYLFAKTQPIGYHGAEAIPPLLVERWKRQMMTPYADLPESEQESDRKEADRVLALLAATQPARVEAGT